MNADHELERLRLELRDRDMEIINLQHQIRQMRCCCNCEHAEHDGAGVQCMAAMSKECYPPDLCAWEFKQ